NELMQSAWNNVRSLLIQRADGYVLDLATQAELRSVGQAWLCPVTRRVLATTLAGLTPYLPAAADGALLRCESIEMPELPHAYWRTETDEQITADAVQTWLNGDEKVIEARRQGFWTE